MRTKTEDGRTIVYLEGRISSSNSEDLQRELSALVSASGDRELILDAEALEYISSAGLRVVLLAHKLMLPTGGKMIIRQPSAFCKQVLEATGMDSILTVE